MRGVGAGEVVLQQVEIESVAVHRYFIGMQNLVRRGEHGVRPFHAHHLREFRHVFGRKEQDKGVEVHAHHALLEDVARLASDDVARSQMVRFVIDRELCLPMRHHGKKEAFNQDIRDVEIAHFFKVAEDGDVVIAVEVELAVNDSLKIEFLHLSFTI